MIINKTVDSYTIKLPKKYINIYNSEELEKLTKKIVLKANKINKLKNYIHIEIFLNINYGTIIKLTDYDHPFTNKNEKTVKITIHTDTIFLYQIDYFNIYNKKRIKENIYYYKNKFYLEIKEEISEKDYQKLLELSNIIYEDTNTIMDKGIKI